MMNLNSNLEQKIKGYTMSNILLVGFQRSGTTLSRRLLQLHPEIKHMLHEQFLLKRYNTAEKMNTYLKSKNISNSDTWGEKTPYFPSVRKIPVVKYCQMWNDIFEKNARIIHIVRHPMDIAFSTVKKFKNINTLDKPINVYKSVIIRAINGINELGNAYTFKYEDLLIDPDRVLKEMYEFCGVNGDIDWRSLMSKIKNERYRSINAGRAFDYKNKKIDGNYDLKEIIKNVNELVGGIEYEW